MPVRLAPAPRPRGAVRSARERHNVLFLILIVPAALFKWMFQLMMVLCLLALLIVTVAAYTIGVIHMVIRLMEWEVTTGYALLILAPVRLILVTLLPLPLPIPFPLPKQARDQAR